MNEREQHTPDGMEPGVDFDPSLIERIERDLEQYRDDPAMVEALATALERVFTRYHDDPAFKAWRARMKAELEREPGYQERAAAFETALFEIIRADFEAPSSDQAGS